MRMKMLKFMDMLNEKRGGFMTEILREDMEILSNSNLPFHQYRNSTFLITGSTGLIGSLLIKNLLFCNKKFSLNLKIIAVIRNEKKAKNIFKEYLTDAALTFYHADLRTDELNITCSLDYIIHAAAITSSKKIVENPVDTIQTELHGLESIFKLALKNKVKCVEYISSMEVYGSINQKDKVEETQLGQIDLSNVRSCYPESKRMCECMCKAYASQYGVHIVSARLAQTFGAGILQKENRVFAQFARSVINNRNIILHTEGKSEGNYVYTRDAVKGILMLLVNGHSGEVYNITNEDNHMTIREMAETVALKIADGKISVKTDIEKSKEQLGYAPDVKLFLSAEKIKKIGWNAEVSMEDAYRRMISDMVEEENINEKENCVNGLM